MLYILWSLDGSLWLLQKGSQHCTLDNGTSFRCGDLLCIFDSNIQLFASVCYSNSDWIVRLLYKERENNNGYHLMGRERSSCKTSYRAELQTEHRIKAQIVSGGRGRICFHPLMVDNQICKLVKVVNGSYVTLPHKPDPTHFCKIVPNSTLTMLKCIATSSCYSTSGLTRYYLKQFSDVHHAPI